jgi:hypothetical protein
MRLHILLLCACPFVGISATAQFFTHGPGGGTPGGGAVAGTPGGANAAGGTGAGGGAAGSGGTSGNQLAGFVYRLPYHYLIYYAETDSTVSTIPRYGGLANNQYIVETQVTKDTIVCKSDLVKLSNALAFTTLGQGGQTIIKDSCKERIVWHLKRPLKKDTICLSPSQCSTAPPLFIHKNIHYDSVSRYWDRPLRPLIDRYRLRVSITAADSGKLSLGIYDNNYAHGHNPAPQGIIAVKMKDGVNLDSVEFAKPIDATDSAQAMYLRVHNKRQFKEPLYYYPIHFAVTQFGAFTIPFKYRWAPKNSFIYNKTLTPTTKDSVLATPSESTGSINIAAYVARKWGTTKFYFNSQNTHNTLTYMVSGFIGGALVPLSSSNITFPHLADSLPTQIIAVSLGCAAAIEFHSIDLGFFLGNDISLQHNSYWVYNKKWWIGFGIGINLNMFSNGSSQAQLGTTGNQ